jgi:hypothetical protein
MPISPDRPWLLLGSTLWLRPLEESDLPGLRAFLRRKDVVRAGNTAARLRPSDPGRAVLAPGPGVSLVALDPLGAPAGVFHLRETRSGVVLSFAVPRDEPAILRECIRLLILPLAARTRAPRLTISGLAPESEVAPVLLATGWSQEADHLIFELPPASSIAAGLPSHAG